MPLAVIDSREHFEVSSLMRSCRCGGRSICVFTDGSYKEASSAGFTDGSYKEASSAGFGVFMETHTKGMAARIDLAPYFPDGSQQSLPDSLGTDVLLIELIAIEKALQWVAESYSYGLTCRDEVQVFTDSAFSLFLLKQVSEDHSLSTMIRVRPSSDSSLISHVLLPVLHSIVSVADSLKCNVNLQKVKAHVGIHGNEMADRLAKMGRCLPLGRPVRICYGSDLPLPPTQVATSKHSLPSPFSSHAALRWRPKVASSPSLLINVDC